MQSTVQHASAITASEHRISAVTTHMLASPAVRCVPTATPSAPARLLLQQPLLELCCHTRCRSTSPPAPVSARAVQIFRCGVCQPLCHYLGPSCAAIQSLRRLAICSTSASAAPCIGRCAAAISSLPTRAAQRSSASAVAGSGANVTPNSSIRKRTLTIHGIATAKGPPVPLSTRATL